MSDPKSYRATPAELRAIDQGLAGPDIPEAELPTHYRVEAARLRQDADTAETIELRIMLLEAAERFERIAESFSTPPPA